MVTIKDVARKAEVSPASVSKVINKRPHVSPKTKAKVLKAIQELNYEPNATARKLVMKTTENIGFIIRSSTKGRANPFYVKILDGVESVIKKEGFNLLFSTVEEKLKGPENLPKKIKESNVDGLIIVGIIDNNFIYEIIKKELPLVLVDYYLKEKELNYVLTDDLRGAYKAVSWLIELGHRKIAMINGPQTHTSFLDRFRGYKLTLLDHGIKYEKEYVQTVPKGGIECGYRAGKHLLELKQPPSAVFCANDNIAIGAMKIIKDRGLRIPGDISVVGFDDIEQASHIEPPLTTVRVHNEELGRVAVQKLIEAMNNRSKRPERTIIPTELIIRESASKVKNK